MFVWRHMRSGHMIKHVQKQHEKLVQTTNYKSNSQQPTNACECMCACHLIRKHFISVNKRMNSSFIQRIFCAPPSSSSLSLKRENPEVSRGISNSMRKNLKTLLNEDCAFWMAGHGHRAELLRDAAPINMSHMHVREKFRDSHVSQWEAAAMSVRLHIIFEFIL